MRLIPARRVWTCARHIGPGGLDETEARKAFNTMVDAQKEMFEFSLKARKRIDAILTNEQKEQLRRKWGR